MSNHHERLAQVNGSARRAPPRSSAPARAGWTAATGAPPSCRGIPAVADRAVLGAEGARSGTSLCTVAVTAGVTRADGRHRAGVSERLQARRRVADAGRASAPTAHRTTVLSKLMCPPSSSAAASVAPNAASARRDRHGRPAGGRDRDRIEQRDRRRSSVRPPPDAARCTTPSHSSSATPTPRRRRAAPRARRSPVRRQYAHGREHGRDRPTTCDRRPRPWRPASARRCRRAAAPRRTRPRSRPSRQTASAATT